MTRTVYRPTRKITSATPHGERRRPTPDRLQKCRAHISPGQQEQTTVRAQKCDPRNAGPQGQGSTLAAGGHSESSGADPAGAETNRTDILKERRACGEPRKDGEWTGRCTLAGRTGADQSGEREGRENAARQSVKEEMEDRAELITVSVEQDIPVEKFIRDGGGLVLRYPVEHDGRTLNITQFARPATEPAEVIPKGITLEIVLAPEEDDSTERRAVSAQMSKRGTCPECGAGDTEIGALIFAPEWWACLPCVVRTVSDAIRKEHPGMRERTPAPSRSAQKAPDDERKPGPRREQEGAEQP